MIVSRVPGDPFAVAACLSSPVLALEAPEGLDSPWVAHAVRLWPALAEQYPFSLAPVGGLWCYTTPRGNAVALFDPDFDAWELAHLLSAVSSRLVLAVHGSHPALLTALAMSSVPGELLVVESSP